MKLKGHAKSLDIIAMMFDSAQFSIKFGALCSYVEESFVDIREIIQPGSTPNCRMFPSPDMSLFSKAGANRISAMSARSGPKATLPTAGNGDCTGCILAAESVHMDMDLVESLDTKLS